jgi:circadian clock protein KaiC
VVGACGTGKTVFCTGFVYAGTLQKENGVIACFNEPPRKLRDNSKPFGWDLRAMEKKGKLLLVDASSPRAGTTSLEEHSLRNLNFDDALHYILSACRKINAKRLAIDSLSSMLASTDNPRTALSRLTSTLEKAGITSVLSTEPLGRNEGFVEEHLADAVIVLKKREGTRLLEIKKMRGSPHSLYEHPYRISEMGIAVDKAAVTF